MGGEQEKYGYHYLCSVLCLASNIEITTVMKPRIVLIEDDKVNAIVFQHYFQGEFDIVHMLEGYDLLEELLKFPADVVILDINLGKDDINGIMLVNAIRNTPQLSDTVVFALTGYATQGDEDLFLSKGFNRYIPKPIDFEYVKSIIWDSIQNRHTAISN